jgi:hypothetical protein
MFRGEQRVQGGEDYGTGRVEHARDNIGRITIFSIVLYQRKNALVEYVKAVLKCVLAGRWRGEE